MTFGEKLQKLRRESALSQEKLAEQLHVSRQAISKWERAESSPDTDNLIALARLYGISLDGHGQHRAAEQVFSGAAGVPDAGGLHRPQPGHGVAHPAPGAAGGASGTGKTAFLVEEGQADLVCSGGIPVGILDFFVQL